MVELAEYGQVCCLILAAKRFIQAEGKIRERVEIVAPIFGQQIIFEVLRIDTDHPLGRAIEYPTGVRRHESKFLTERASFTIVQRNKVVNERRPATRVAPVGIEAEFNVGIGHGSD